MTNFKLDFVLNITKFYYILSKTLDSKLGWLWFNDFIVLYILSEAENQTLKRIDLAEKMWLTASWVTRLLLPMEKIWLVKKEVNESDARVSLVTLASWWRQKLEEALERINFFLDENFDLLWGDKILDFSKFLKLTWWKMMWK